MRTTVDLDEHRLREVMRIFRARSKREALHRAMDDCIRRDRAGTLLALAGHLRFDLGWRQMEEK